MGETSNEGSFTLETRQFESDGDDGTYENQRSLLWEHKTEVVEESNGLVFGVKGRYDDQDHKRNITWPEDLYFYQKNQSFKFVVGYQIFNYSYMEAFNPLDILNARQYDTSILNAEKMGELSLGLETYVFDGDLKLYLLPRPAKPYFPSSSSRLRADLDQVSVAWLGGDVDSSEWDDHFLLSFERSFDSFDAQFLVSKNIDRRKVLVGTTDYQEISGNIFPKADADFALYFSEQLITGAIVVYNFESFQVKSGFASHTYIPDTEILTNSGLTSFEDYSELVLGAEVPISHANGFDSTVFVEYQKIIPDSVSATGALQNDVFLAWKLNFNDPTGTEIKTAMTYDVSGNEEGFVQADFSRRYLSDFKYTIGILSYLNTESYNPPLDDLDETNHIYANLTYFY